MRAKHANRLAAILFLGLCGAASADTIAIKVWQPTEQGGRATVDLKCAADFHIPLDVTARGNGCTPDQTALTVHTLCLTALHSDPGLAPLMTHMPADPHDASVAQLGDKTRLAKGQEALGAALVEAEKSCDAYFATQAPTQILAAAIFSAERSKESDAWALLTQKKGSWGGFNQAMKDAYTAQDVPLASVYQTVNDARTAESRRRADQITATKESDRQAAEAERRAAEQRLETYRLEDQVARQREQQRRDENRIGDTGAFTGNPMTQPNSAYAPPPDPDPPRPRSCVAASGGQVYCSP